MFPNHAGAQIQQVLFSCDLQNLLNLLHVLQAASFLHFTSALVLLAMDPRYLKPFMITSIVPSRVAIWTGSGWLYTRHFIFLVLAFNQMLRDSVVTLFKSSRAFQISSDNNTMSSAKSRFINTIRSICLICHFLRQNPCFSSLHCIAFLRA